jgi:Domain of unknown function (DUF4271)
MKWKCLLSCILFCFVLPLPYAFSQDDKLNELEELPVSRNPYVAKDSTDLKKEQKFQKAESLAVLGTAYGQRVRSELQRHEWYKSLSVSNTVQILERGVLDTDWMFYLFCGLLFALAFLRIVFNKYFNDLFRVFFNTSIRQRQIRDQLQQAPLPSLLFNIFFAFSGGIFIFFLLRHYKANIDLNKWLLIGVCIVGLGALYLGKHLLLKLIGWVFGWEKGVETYLFIVFLVNKIIGILLLPFIVLLAFSPPTVQGIIVTISIIGLLVVFIYRFVRAYSSIRNELRISQLHFFLYVCAFEVVPLLLIYRLLMQII